MEEKYLAQYCSGSWDIWVTFAECDTIKEAVDACKREKTSDEVEAQYRVIESISEDRVW